MSDLKQETIFTNIQLDTDTDQRFMSVGAAPYHCNILVGEEGANAVVTNMKGNKQGSVSYPLTNSNIYLVIGSYYNRLTRKVYYFVWGHPYDSTGSDEYIYDNKLLCYNEDEETIDCIFTDTKNYFGLHFNHFMKDCEMIGDWLFFNPRVSEPKMIDVKKAYNYENYDAYDATLSYIYGDKVIYKGGLFVANTAVIVGESPVNAVAKWDRMGSAYQDTTNLNFASEFKYAFNVIKMPPINAPVIAYGTDTDVVFNNVKGKVFRFSHRYKYFDNSYSVYSAYSDLIYPVNEEQWDGEYIDDEIKNNYINISVSLHSPALIKEIEIVFQEIGQDWCRCKVINRIDQEELDELSFSYNFYNNESYPVVDSTEIAKIEDAVPRTSSTQAIINKNILCYGGCKEGFVKLDKNDIDVTLTPEIRAIDFESGRTVQQVVLRDCYANNDLHPFVSDPENVFLIGWSLNLSGKIVDWGISDGDAVAIMIDGAFYSAIFSAADVANDTALVTKLSTVITGTNLLVRAVDAELLIYRFGEVLPIITQFVFFTPSGVLSMSTNFKARGFKTGAYHPFCIFYYDDSLRRWEAHTSKNNIPGLLWAMDGTTVYVPTFNEVSSPQIDTANRWVVNWSVNHLPPDGAKYWRWGYSGNTLCSYFVQYIIAGITDGADEEEGMSVIDIEPLQTLKNTTEATYNQFPHSNIEPYTWAKGDRIRFITEGIADPSVPGTVLGDVIEGVYDYEIIKQTEDAGVYNIYIQEIDFAAVGIGENSLVEIYRPIKSTSDSLRNYYEFGGIMPILEDANGYNIHGGITQDQDYLADIPATGTFDAGDVFHITRTPSKPICSATGETTFGAFHESQWWSDFYISDDWGKGKTGQETSFGERNLNIIRYSNPYLQNTLINGLSTFEGTSYKELNDIYGDIKAIMEIGNTLKCYQRTKPSSILIGRQEYTDTEGNTTVATSTSVLGSIRYSTTNYGTEFPESLSRNNRYVYGYDIYNATVFRDSANGIFPISGRFVTTEGDTDYKMSSFFKDISKSLMLSGIVNVKVMTVWDEEYKMLYISFHDAVNEDNNKTVVFHEPSNKWLCFAEFEIVNHNGYNVILELTYDILKGFQGGIGYEFDEETRFAIFNIVTGSGVLGYFGTIGLSFEALEPTVMLSSNPSQDMIDLLFTPQEPTVYISFTHLSKTDIEWDYDEYGLPESQDLEVDTSESYCTITAKPTWLIVMLIDTPLYVGSTIPDGATLFLAPLVENTGPELNDTFTVEDAWGNSASLAVKHRENLAGVTVYVLATTPPPLIVTDNGCTGTYGSANIVINFTPNSPEHTLGQTYTVDYTITKNGSSAGMGTISVTEEQANTQTLTMGSTAVNGDIINVYLEYNE